MTDQLAPIDNSAPTFTFEEQMETLQLCVYQLILQSNARELRLAALEQFVQAQFVLALPTHGVQ